jgi:predicted RNA-binding Zn-ribbon protein involved in translation (DUF1610 family)
MNDAVSPKCALHGPMDKLREAPGLVIYRCSKCGTTVRRVKVRKVARIYRGNITG